MSFDLERLYSLLPAIHRIRDVEVAAQIGGLLTGTELAELAVLRSLSRSSSSWRAM